jgi:hypothetical protein
MKSQKRRILDALRNEGSRGITSVDFDPPHVYDEGDPIQRVAARILDLKGDGHDITTDGTRNGVAVYRLRQPKPAPVDVTTDPAPESLFQVGMQPARSSAYFGEDAA